MGTFIIGVLVGWLAEWLFFTFFMKGNSTDNTSDCSGLEASLSAKNAELSKLKAELESANKSVASSAVIKDSVQSSAKKKADTTKVVAKTTATKATSKKPAVAKTTVKKAATKTSTVKKTPAKKTTAPKKTTVKKPALKKGKVGNDFTKLSGIGPSMSNTLNELGITSYQKLADMDDDILRDMLEASGARLNNNKEAMDSWNEQATLAAKGDFDGLKKLQEELKK